MCLSLRESELLEAAQEIVAQLYDDRAERDDWHAIADKLAVDIDEAWRLRDEAQDERDEARDVAKSLLEQLTRACGERDELLRELDALRGKVREVAERLLKFEGWTRKNVAADLLSILTAPGGGERG